MKPPSDRLIDGTLLAIVLVLLAAGMLPPLGCTLTTAERAALSAAEPAILAADAWACNEAADLVQVAGPFVDAAVCPGWEAAVKAELDKLTAAPAASAKVVTRKGVVGKLVAHRPPLGSAAALEASVVALQQAAARLDAGAEGGTK